MSLKRHTEEKVVLAVQAEVSMKSNYEQTSICQAVFRAYDIRGIIDEQLTENSYYTIGKAIAYELGDKTDIILGRDGRLSSPKLAQALSQGLLDSGINVIDIGLVSSPVLYYATHTLGCDSGVMVTGSHNPSEYNGIKIVLSGKTLVNEDIQRLYQHTVAKRVRTGCGQYKTQQVVDDYIHTICQGVALNKTMKVVIDCGNGVAGLIAPKLFKQLGCDVEALFCDVDGRFPNHHPDPTIEQNLIQLKQRVKETNADIGLAFDGDADRIGVVTNKLEVIWPDRLMMMYAKDILSRHERASIVYDVKCTAHLTHVIKQANGIPIMSPTGHSIVKGLMKQNNALLAGEMSGHIFFKERWYGFDDALYSGARLLEILSKSHMAVDEQFRQIPDSINTPEIKIAIDDSRKFDFMKQLIESADFGDAILVKIDGLRVEFENGWGLIRASNTTPCLVTRFEAECENTLVEIQQKVKEQLLRVDGTLEIPF